MTVPTDRPRERHAHRGPGAADKIAARLARTKTVGTRTRVVTGVVSLSVLAGGMLLSGQQNPEPAPASASAASSAAVGSALSQDEIAATVASRKPVISRSLSRATAITADRTNDLLRAAIEDAEKRAAQKKARLARIAAAKEAARKEAAQQARQAARKQARRDALAARVEARAAAQATAESQAVASTDPGTLRDMARREMLAFGFAADQWTYLDQLVMRESGWNPRAQNPSSGAYGLPQSLPGSKMASEGADWQTNPVTQIRWMLKYIAGRYGTPGGAWSHSQSVGWY